MRQDRPLVRGYAITHPAGLVELPTQPGWDQIIYAKSGLFVARTSTGSWVIPRHRAICVPDGTQVQIVTRNATTMRCLFLPDDLHALGGVTKVINVGSLARELLVHAVEASPLYLEEPIAAALVTVLIDQLEQQLPTALHLPFPLDRRAKDLADAVEVNPAATLDEMIAAIPASRRTLERLFGDETTMTLAAWHRRARVLAAIELMAGECSVTHAAVAVGYATPSSFVAAFKSELGLTPKTFMAALVT